MSVEFDPFHPEAIADPYPLYRRLREQAPVLWSDRFTSWFLFRHSDVSDFFRQPHLSADRTLAVKFKGPPRREEVRSLGSDPPEHTAVRTLLNRSLNPAMADIGQRLDAMVAELLRRIPAAVDGFMDEADLRDEVDLIGHFAYPLPIAVIAEMFDIPPQDRQHFRSWSHDVARGMDHFYAKGGSTERFSRLSQYFRDLIVVRRRRPGGDLLSRLMEAESDADRFTDAELVHLCTTLLFAGHETTVNLIGNGLLALLRNPDQLRRVRQDERVWTSAVEECLRFDSPAQLIARTALEPFDLHGHEVRSGDAVVAVLGAANRDPSVFERPDVLDVSRRPNPHVAFGSGIHFCAGASLSRQEARAAIPALLRRFPRLRLAEKPPEWRNTIVLRGLKSLPVLVD